MSQERLVRRENAGRRYDVLWTGRVVARQGVGLVLALCPGSATFEHGERRELLELTFCLRLAENLPDKLPERKRLWQRAMII